MGGKKKQVSNVCTNDNSNGLVNNLDIQTNNNNNINRNTFISNKRKKLKDPNEPQK